MRKALLALLLLACGSPASETGSASAPSTGGAVVDFAGDFSVTESGDLVPAGSLTFRYDLGRLPKCRFVEYGQPAWSVLAYVSFDGRAPQALELAPNGGTTSGTVETTIPVPAAKDVAFWFYASDDSGCVQWDSRYGQNFHFGILPSPRPVIHFGGDWQNRVDGAVGPGTVLVDYDLSRAQCHGSQYGSDAYAVTMYTSIDGDTPQPQTITTLVDGRNFATPRYVSLPQGDHTLAIWFENTDVFGCHAWDSNYGNNYSFSY
jgi:hypothetical protein